MKKINFFVAALLLGTIIVKANPVAVNTAQKVAANFYSQSYHSTPQTLTLAYTESSSNGQPVYYVFDIDSNDGFVIVSAEDADDPIIGSSNTGQYVIPTANNNFGYWMEKRKSEIVSMRANKVAATSDVANEWSAYINNTVRSTHGATTVTSVSPLCSTTWDQPYPYNGMCPSGSVTGCVATTMAQIMKYWAYPSVGLSSNCYSEEKAKGYSENYGELCATFDTSNYLWSAMPNKVTSPNSQVAKLMYDCGVSVDMDYSPSESGAYVIGNYNNTAQTSYVNYFNYKSSTIKGVYESHYSTAGWISLIEGELIAGRPVQYQGTDTAQGGHSWVCDGFNANNQLHMNWGWSGYDDGYYAVTSLVVDGYDFNSNIGAVIGIEPPSEALAVPQISNSQTTKVYPNPNNGIFNVQLEGVTGNPQIGIYNVLGQEVYSSKLISLQTSINLSNQPKGIYLYRVLNENGEPVSTGRIIIE